VLRQPIAPELEVEVRAGGDLAGVAAQGDGLAAAHAVPDALEEAAVVLVNRKVAVGVLDRNRVAAVVGPVGENDVAVADGAHGRALLSGEVDGVVAAGGVEAAGEETGQRREGGELEAGEVALGGVAGLLGERLGREA